jgi:SnoaL-like domain
MCAISDTESEGPAVPDTAVRALMRRNLFEVFNERDPERRAKAIAELYGVDLVFYEQDNVVKGPEALQKRVQELLDDAPGFVFSADGEGSENHNVGRLTWHLGPVGARPVATGTDVAITSDGRIQALYTFVEGPATRA